MGARTCHRRCVARGLLPRRILGDWLIPRLAPKSSSPLHSIIGNSEEQSADGGELREIERPNEDVLRHIGRVWDHLRVRSGLGLSKDTHDKDSPWHVATNPPRDFFQRTIGWKLVHPIIEDALIRRFCWEAGLWRFRKPEQMRPQVWTFALLKRHPRSPPENDFPDMSLSYASIWFAVHATQVLQYDHTQKLYAKFLEYILTLLIPAIYYLSAKT